MDSVDYRSSDGHQDGLLALADGLVRLNPDVLVAAGLDAVVAQERDANNTHRLGDTC